MCVSPCVSIIINRPDHGQVTGKGNLMSAGGSNQLLSVANAAEFLDVPERTLRDRWRSWGIPAYRVGRAYRFRVRDLEQWLAGCREAA